MIPDNQTARRIQSKNNRGLGAEPLIGGMGGKVPREGGGLGGRLGGESPIQNQPYLKN